MQFKQVDPYAVNVDEMNERKNDALNLGDLEESIAEVGIVQPPMVRVRDQDAEVPYTAVIGQRRVMAAQSADVDEIPIVVMDWDDEEALKASISENMDLFREKVGGKDRARALERLWFEMGGEGMPSPSKLGEELGVPRLTISNWTEYLRPEYEGTELHAKYVSEEAGDHQQESVKVDEVGERTLQSIRNATGGGEQAVELAKEVERKNLTQADVQEIQRRKDAGESVDEAVESVKQINRGPAAKTYSVKISGVLRVKLEGCAADRGTVETDVIRDALREHLDQHDYFDDVPSEKRRQAMEEHR